LEFSKNRVKWDLCFQATRSTENGGRCIANGEKQNEKQDYQDSAVDDDVARNWLDAGPGGHFACAPLLSQAVRREIALARNRWTRSSRSHTETP
jgi:hypothetical protein